MATPVSRIGLTGGIGSGKSTVAGMLAGLGCVVIDADAISRKLTGVGGAAIGEIAKRFGPLALLPDGSLNRDWIRAQIFSNGALRHDLEAIIHPLVRAETSKQAQLAVDQGGATRTTLIFDVPLLVESGQWRMQLDRVVVVDCLKTTQIARVLAREAGRTGWSADTVEKIIDGQAKRFERLAAADICIFNDGLSLSALHGLVRQLAKSFGL
jgi:dephospho-CoA kinase